MQLGKMAAEKGPITAARTGFDQQVAAEYKLLSDPGHSAATIINSSLTASVAGDGFSQPTKRSSRPPMLERSLTPLKVRPSRIPTPVGVLGKASPRNFTAPVSSNQKKEVSRVM